VPPDPAAISPADKNAPEPKGAAEMRAIVEKITLAKTGPDERGHSFGATGERRANELFITRFKAAL